MKNDYNVFTASSLKTVTCSVMNIFLCIKIFLGRCQHQLDTVELIYLTGAGIIVDGDNIGFRVAAPQFLDNSFATI